MAAGRVCVTICLLALGSGTLFFSATAGGACPILSGFHAAILSYLAGRQLAAREVHCSSEPGNPCLFVVATEDRLTKLLIATPGSADHELLMEITGAENGGDD